MAKRADWYALLNRLLILDQSLDQLARDRYAKDGDPEKPPVTPHHRLLTSRLFSLFRDFGCASWLAKLLRGDDFPASVLAEEEKAALHALIEWLKRFAGYPHYTRPKEKRQLEELRDRLERAVLDRLEQLESKRGRSDSKSIPTLEPPELQGTEARAYKVIENLAGKGISGKEVISVLKRDGVNITLSTFYRHIAPILKQHGVKNLKAIGGYYLDESTD
jgi:hypothetical protein